MAKQIRAKCPRNFPSGRVWAALDADLNVLDVIEARTPPSVDFEAHKAAAKETLAALGKVSPGNIVYEADGCWFISLPKVTHEGRRRKKSENSEAKQQ